MHRDRRVVKKCVFFFRSKNVAHFFFGKKWFFCRSKASMISKNTPRPKAEEFFPRVYFHLQQKINFFWNPKQQKIVFFFGKTSVFLRSLAAVASEKRWKQTKFTHIPTRPHPLNTSDSPHQYRC